TDAKQAICVFRYPPRAGGWEYGCLSCGMGFGVFVRHGLGVVPGAGGICVAAGHLLDFYPAVGVLPTAWTAPVAARRGGLCMRGGCFGSDSPFGAGGPGAVWRVDAHWQLHAA